MADYTPVFTGGAVPFTATTSAAVTGGRVLLASATGTVATATAQAATCVGVAAHDAPSGGKVSVWPIANVIHEIEAVATVTAGTAVAAAAAGLVETAAAGAAATAGSLQTVIGLALTTATSPNKVRFLGRY